MTRIRFVVGLAACCLLAGCLVCPEEPTISEPSNVDFGFVGKWKSIPDVAKHDPDDMFPVADERDTDEAFSITQDQNGVYHLITLDGELMPFEFRALPLDENSTNAIIEFRQTKEDKVEHFLAIAERKDQMLSVWLVRPDNLAKLMFREGYSAVIEHKMARTNVFAKPDDLIAVLRKHSKELIDDSFNFATAK